MALTSLFGSNNSRFQNLTYGFNEDTLSPQVLSLTQSVSVETLYTRDVTASLTLSHLLNLDLVVNLTPNSTLSFTNEATVIVFRNISNTLVISSDALGYKISEISIEHTLELTQAVSKSTIYTFSLSDTLVFTRESIRPTSINGFLYNITVPEVIYSKKYNRISFRTQNRAIVLKPPMLNDGEGNAGQIVLQRTINGTAYVYARRTSTRKLKYSFEVDQFKAYEMRKFMWDCLSDLIWIENWKGELWVGYFTNNPFEITTKNKGFPCGDSYLFDVEFEGLRIH